MALCLRVWLAVLGASALVGIATWMLWADLPLVKLRCRMAVAASSLSQWMAQWAARGGAFRALAAGASCNRAGRRWRKWAQGCWPGASGA